MSDIGKNSDKGKEKKTPSLGRKFDAVRSQHPSQSERQRKPEKQLSGTPSERRSRLTSSLASTKDLMSLEFKNLSIYEKKKNPLGATHSERRYRRISSLAPVRNFTGLRVQEKRKLRGGMDTDDTSNQQEPMDQTAGDPVPQRLSRVATPWNELKSSPPTKEDEERWARQAEIDRKEREERIHGKE